jgi:hypothetical protein
MEGDPAYLGDGVYATFDDQVWVWVERSADCWDKIALEAVVLQALVRYAWRHGLPV